MVFFFYKPTAHRTTLSVHSYTGKDTESQPQIFNTQIYFTLSYPILSYTIYPSIHLQPGITN